MISPEKRLISLIKECSEVINTASNILENGYDSKNSNISNKAYLEKELGNIYALAGSMALKQEISWTNVVTHSTIKERVIRNEDCLDGCKH